MLEACIALARNQLADTRQCARNLVERHPTVYWDVSGESVHGEEHAAFVIERMLENGTLSGIQDLLIAFSRDQLAEVVVRSRRISRKTALFWRNFLGIKGAVHCLKEGSQEPLSKRWE